MSTLYDNLKFQVYWDTVIKPLALECSRGAELSDKLNDAKTETEINSICAQMKKYGRKDWESASSIYNMIQKIENSKTNEIDIVGVLYDTIRILDSKNYDKKMSILRNNKEIRDYKKLDGMLYQALEFLDMCKEIIEI